VGPGRRIYFGGRLIGRSGIPSGQGVVTDRLGSVGGPARYYPYGGERQATPERTEKFATYYRDATGLDYAWNRYYTAAWGRFMQADPYLAPEALKNPQAWNRYAYGAGDPVNYYDPAGLFIEVPVPFPPLPAVYNVTTVLGENGWLERVGGAVADFESGGEVSEGSADGARLSAHTAEPNCRHGEVSGSGL